MLRGERLSADEQRSGAPGGRRRARRLRGSRRLSYGIGGEYELLPRPADERPDQLTWPAVASSTARRRGTALLARCQEEPMRSPRFITIMSIADRRDLRRSHSPRASPGRAPPTKPKKASKAAVASPALTKQLKVLPKQAKQLPGAGAPASSIQLQALNGRVELARGALREGRRGRRRRPGGPRGRPRRPGTPPVPRVRRGRRDRRARRATPAPRARKGRARPQLAGRVGGRRGLRQGRRRAARRLVVRRDRRGPDRPATCPGRHPSGRCSPQKATGGGGRAAPISGFELEPPDTTVAGHGDRGRRRRHTCTNGRDCDGGKTASPSTASMARSSAARSAPRQQRSAQLVHHLPFHPHQHVPRRVWLVCAQTASSPGPGGAGLGLYSPRVRRHPDRDGHALRCGSAR